MQPEDSILPWSFEAEASVLSALLMNPERYDMVADLLTPEKFNDLNHRTIFTTIASMVMANKPVDVVTVYEAMERAGTLDSVSIGDLHDLCQFAPAGGNLRRYAEIVSERAMMRGLMAAADKAREVAIAPGLTVGERLDQCQNLFQQLTVQRGNREPKIASEIAIGMIDRLQELAEGKRTPGIRTRIPTLDSMLGGGLKEGKQIVVAARPSVGKSAFAMEIAYQAASEGYPAAVLSQEMESYEWIERLTARIGSVRLDGFSHGKLEESEWTGVADAVDLIGRLPLHIDDQPGLTLSDIQAKARKLKREHGIKVLVIDYLQLCTPSDGRLSRHHQIEEISRGLKVLAKQLGLTTIVLSQLNRAVETRVTGKPTLADLKESGAIEEDADTVILLSPEAQRENGDVVVCAEVAKNRGGRKGFVKLAFTGKYQRFVETVHDPRDAAVQKTQRRAYSEEV